MNDIYLELIEPNNFISHFKDLDAFEKWLSIGTKEDLRFALKEFEKAELYEYCQIIHNRVKMHDTK